MSAYTPPMAVNAKGGKTKDPNAPKRAVQAFQFYRKHLLANNPDFKALSFGDQSSELSRLWTALPSDEKEEFNAAHESDKER
jgi:hypothetical protein